MNVLGSAYTIAEVGEQLGWLVAALQKSESPSSISFSKPQILVLPHPEDSGSSSNEGSGRNYSCTLGCITEQVPSTDLGDGRCWHRLFNNPVIVECYPVPPRLGIGLSTGLEIPLNILIALADTPVFTTFDSKSLLKGYSSMLVPTKQVDNIIIWHFIQDENNTRLSFLDPRLSDLCSVDPIAWENRHTRHIVGWCAYARSVTGMLKASSFPFSQDDVETLIS